MIVTSISAVKSDAEQLKADLADFRKELARLGLEQNMSKIFRALVRGEIEISESGNATILVNLDEAA